MILAVILYIRQPLFLIHSVLGNLSAMPRKSGCPLAESCVSTNIFTDWPQDPHRLSMTILPTYLPSPPTCPLHLRTLYTYLASHSPDERPRVCKVSAKGNPVFKDMASKSLRTKCMRNKGCRIYRMTARITASAMKSCQV